MKNIKKYENYIKESLTEFEFQQPGLSGITTGTGVQANNDTLSLDGFDRHKNNLRYQFTRLNHIMNSIFNNATMFNKATTFDSDVKDLSILRIYKNNALSVDVYIKFFYNSEEYYGIFKNWNTDKLEFKSEFYKHPVMSFESNRIKFIGVLQKTLENWFSPKEGKYKTLKDITVYDEYGHQKIIDSNYEIEVEEVITQENKPKILINFKGKIYTFTDLDYFYFHWWFEEINLPKFYI